MPRVLKEFKVEVEQFLPVCIQARQVMWGKLPMPKHMYWSRIPLPKFLNLTSEESGSLYLFRQNISELDLWTLSCSISLANMLKNKK